MNPILWLTPAIIAVFLYGIGQGLVKKYIGDVTPARFCLYFFIARSIVFLSYFFTQQHKEFLHPAGIEPILIVIFVYILDGLGWILYFQSIVYGPIAIVGTLSAAYPALTVLFAGIFLHETLAYYHYIAVIFMILGCVGLSYAPPDPKAKATNRSWIPLAAGALLLWGGAQTILKYAYYFPMADEVNFCLCATIGAMLTLGFYGIAGGGLKGGVGKKALGQSFLPMGMMAGGDLGVILATKLGPVSIVAPLTASYPVVTIGFAALILKEKITKLQGLCILIILAGMGLTSYQTEQPNKVVPHLLDPLTEEEITSAVAVLKENQKD